jgi:hypothetical protein
VIGTNLRVAARQEPVRKHDPTNHDPEQKQSQVGVQAPTSVPRRTAFTRLARLVVSAIKRRDKDALRPLKFRDPVTDAMIVKGVSFEHYEMPGLSTDAKGIARMGDDERAAWFKDPEGNILSLWQLRA